MRKDKEIWLEAEEIQQLLEGGLYWTDIESKLSPENADSFRKHLSTEQDLEIGVESKPATAIKEASEEQDIRAILLGEEKVQDSEASTEALGSVVKNRQIDLSQFEEKPDGPFIPQAATTEEENPNIQEDNEFKEIMISSEIEPEEEHTPFGGLKLVILLAVVAALTFGFWYYFLSS
jgi:hypothetical protein